MNLLLDQVRNTNCILNTWIKMSTESVGAKEISKAFVEQEFTAISEKYQLGIDKLKDEQIEVILGILNGRDTIGILPTGFGKSLVFYVLPFLKEKVIFFFFFPPFFSHFPSIFLHFFFLILVLRVGESPNRKAMATTGWISSSVKKKKSRIKVVFLQDQAMYTCDDRLWVQNRAKLEKRVCFWSCSHIWKGHNGKVLKKACKKRVFRV